MRRALGVAKRLLPLLLLSACNPSGGTGADAGRDMATQATSDLSSPGGPDLRVARDLAVATGSVKGVLLDESGAPVAMTTILACNATVCETGMTGADGSFAVPHLLVGKLAVKTEEDLTKTPKLAAAFAPTAIVDQMVSDVGSVYVPTVPAVTTFDPTSTARASYAIGDGLSLSLVPSDLTLPLGADGDDYLGARFVPAAHRAATLDVGGETLVGAWAIVPFMTESASKIGVSISMGQSPIAIAAGDTVHFRSVSELDGSSSAPATGHVTSDGKGGLVAATDPGEGLVELTYVLLSK